MKRLISSLFFMLLLLMGFSVLSQDSLDGQKNDGKVTVEKKEEKVDSAGKTAEKVDSAVKTEEKSDEKAEVLERGLLESSRMVDTLKEDSFTTKSRLLLLREEVLKRSVSGARLVVQHVYKMSGVYELVQYSYSLDKEVIFSRRIGDEDFRDYDGKAIFDSSVAPGNHILSVVLVYKGKRWGVFKYMDDYQFRVESSHSFVVEEDKTMELSVLAVESGKFYTPYENRPTVTYSMKSYDMNSGEMRKNK